MRMFRKFSLIACFTAIIAFGVNGCATVFKGSTDKVSFSAKPEGTKVYVDGSMMGIAPLALELKSNRDYVIEFRNPGYETKTVRLNSSVGGGWVVLDVLFGGLIGVVVDAATGNWNVLDQDSLNAELEKQK